MYDLSHNIKKKLLQLFTYYLKITRQSNGSSKEIVKLTVKISPGSRET